MVATPLAELLDPRYVAELAALPIEEVRSRRDRAMEVEVGRSYVRRLIQGRMDITLSEAKRRETGDPPNELSELVERLPEILSDRVHAPGTGRLPTLLLPADLDRSHIDRLDAMVDPEKLVALPELDEASLRTLIAALDALEREVSGERRALHEVIDRLQGELVRRYRSGEASVDSLLR